MKAMSIAMLLFAVAGLAVAAEQPKSISVDGCTCTGIRKSTGKPWTESECRSSCEMQKTMGGGLYSGFNPATLVAQANPNEPDQRTAQSQSAPTEITRGQVIAGIFVVVLVMGGIFGIGAWRIMTSGPQRRKKKRYRTDQHKMAESGEAIAPAQPPVEAVEAEPPPEKQQLTVVRAPLPEPPVPATPLPIKFGEVVDITHRPVEIERVVESLEGWMNPKNYPWVYWIKGISEFALESYGFQPEVKLFSGGVEMSIQAEHEQTWLKVMAYAIRELLPVSLKVVVIERNEEGSVLILMPEESVRLAVFGEDNVLTLTEGLRQYLLPVVHEQHRRAVGD